MTNFFLIDTMRLLDTILRLFFRKTVDAYDEIVESHWDAYVSWLGTSSGHALNGGHGKPPYLDKRYVVAHKEEILRQERAMEEDRAYEGRRAAVIQAGRRYPTAFQALLRRLSIVDIMDEPMSGVKELRTSGRSILTLERSEYEELYARAGSLPEEDERMRLRYNHEILGNQIRSKYLKDFLKEKGIDGKDIPYLLEHLQELDDYCHQVIDTHFERVRERYPLGLAEFQKRTPQRSDDYGYKVTVLNNLLRIYHLDCEIRASHKTSTSMKKETRLPDSRSEHKRETGKKAKPSEKKTPKGKQAKESREREIERRYSELQKSIRKDCRPTRPITHMMTGRIQRVLR